MMTRKSPECGLDNVAKQSPTTIEYKMFKMPLTKPAATSSFVRDSPNAFDDSYLIIPNYLTPSDHNNLSSFNNKNNNANCDQLFKNTFKF